MSEKSEKNSPDKYRFLERVPEEYRDWPEVQPTQLQEGHVIAFFLDVDGMRSWREATVLRNDDLFWCKKQMATIRQIAFQERDVPRGSRDKPALIIDTFGARQLYLHSQFLKIRLKTAQ